MVIDVPVNETAIRNWHVDPTVHFAVRQFNDFNSLALSQAGRPLSELVTNARRTSDRGQSGNVSFADPVSRRAAEVARWPELVAATAALEKTSRNNLRMLLNGEIAIYRRVERDRRARGDEELNSNLGISDVRERLERRTRHTLDERLLDKHMAYFRAHTNVELFRQFHGRLGGSDLHLEFPDRSIRPESFSLPASPALNEDGSLRGFSYRNFSRGHLVNSSYGEVKDGHIVRALADSVAVLQERETLRGQFVDAVKQSNHYKSLRTEQEQDRYLSERLMETFGRIDQHAGGEGQGAVGMAIYSYGSTISIRALLERQRASNVREAVSRSRSSVPGASEEGGGKPASRSEGPRVGTQAVEVASVSMEQLGDVGVQPPLSTGPAGGGRGFTRTG